MLLLPFYFCACVKNFKFNWRAYLCCCMVMKSEDNAIFILLFLLPVIPITFVAVLHFSFIGFCRLAFFLLVIVFDLAHDFNIFYNCACFFNHGRRLCFYKRDDVFFLQRWCGKHFGEVTDIDITKRLENGFLVLFFRALFCKWVCTAGEGADFTVG